MGLSKCLEKIKELKKLEDNDAEAEKILTKLGKILYQELPSSLVGISGHVYIQTSIFGTTKTIKYKNCVADLKIDRSGWIHFKYGPFKDIYDKLCQVLEIVVSELKYDLYDQTKLEKMRKALASLKGD
jgi:hypothetical protein